MKERKYLVETHTVREIRERTGLSQNKFAAYFGIPPSSLKKWEQNISKAPDYVPAMMDYILNLEDELKMQEGKND